MTSRPRLGVLLVDPSLFTAPYDAALTEGLLAAGVEPTWAVRPTRPGDRQEIPPARVDAFFYRRIDAVSGLPRRLRALGKGLAHALGLARLVGRVVRQKPDVVHFQWTVVPALDAIAIALIRRWCAVVLTVHDTVPFNGASPSRWQTAAFDLPLRLADRVIVHTRSGRSRLVARGVAEHKLSVIPHGPLKLPVLPEPSAPRPRDRRWTFVLFGEIKHYKGVDVLVEALGVLPRDILSGARCIVAGRPRMDLTPILQRIEELGLGEQLELRARRLTEAEMAELFDEADCFLFPYRQIDASGVYFLVKSWSKWIIASDVGVFAEDLKDGVEGVRIAPADPAALASALAAAVTERPKPQATRCESQWNAIGHATRDVYDEVRLSQGQRTTSSQPLGARPW